MNTVETLRALQAAMAAQGLDAYLVPTADPHGSEYVSPHHKVRAFMTGFTGSAGNLLVTKQDARLFVDSRYYLQAEQQIAGSGILLMKEGLPGVPSLSQFILETLPGQTLGLDGRCVSLDQAKAWAKARNGCGCGSDKPPLAGSAPPLHRGSLPPCRPPGRPDRPG